MNTPVHCLIEARDVVKSFGQTLALRGASVGVTAGDILAIMGPSGSGKSTLLHCLAGIFLPDEGEIIFDGQRLHAFQANSNRSCWECTQGTALPRQLPSRGELWNFSVDFYQGQTIERLDVAALGTSAPVPPGVSRLPGPGQYYASPALAALLRTVPSDELGGRFPGSMAGTIGEPRRW